MIYCSFQRVSKCIGTVCCGVIWIHLNLFYIEHVSIVIRRFILDKNEQKKQSSDFSKYIDNIFQKKKVKL